MRNLSNLGRTVFSFRFSVLSFRFVFSTFDFLKIQTSEKRHIWMDLSSGSMIGRCALKNPLQWTSQSVKRTSRGRVMTISLIGRCVSKNPLQRTSQRVKRTSGARVMTHSCVSNLTNLDPLCVALDQSWPYMCRTWPILASLALNNSKYYFSIIHSSKMNFEDSFLTNVSQKVNIEDSRGLIFEECMSENHHFGTRPGFASDCQWLPVWGCFGVTRDSSDPP